MKISLAAKAFFLLSSGVSSFASNIDCTVVKLVHTPLKGEPAEPDEIKCSTEGDKVIYSLGGDIDTFFGEESFAPGLTTLNVPASYISGKIIDLSASGAKDAIVIGKRKVKRGTEHHTGTWKVLAVRITDSSTNTAPSVDAATMATDIFSDALNMRSQYRSCSGNQLTFDPATGTGITDGVLDLSVAYSGKTYSDISDEVNTMLPSDASYTFIFYQYASTVTGLSGGLGTTPGTTTWYGDGLTSILPFTVHEVGHNLGFDHSTFNGEEYGDPTGTMGGGGYCVYGDDDAGRQCFNAPKTYYLGWFSSYHEDVIPTTAAWSGELVPTNDVASGTITSSEDYIVKVSGTGESDLFIMYNYATGITADMAESFRATYGNQVVINSQADLYAKSYLLSGLSAGGTYTKANWAGTTNTLTITVCSITAGSPNKAKIIVYVDGVTTASCSSSTSSPTASPSKAPTATPSKAPTKAPTTTTSAPTVSPSKAPTSAPSKAPTKAPTTSTTSAPTAAPVTSSPTASPVTSSPTASPVTSSPTTAAPVTPSPTASPTSASPTTASPTTAEPTSSLSCDDSETMFKINGRARYCDWVARKKTTFRCGKTGVASHCPDTCGQCAAYECSDSLRKFYLPNGNARKCKFIGRNVDLIDIRCAYTGVASTCRETCGYCD